MNECSICLEDVKEKIFLPCKHWLCAPCVLQSQKCATCTSSFVLVQLSGYADSQISWIAKKDSSVVLSILKQSEAAKWDWKWEKGRIIGRGKVLLESFSNICLTHKNWTFTELENEIKRQEALTFQDLFPNSGLGENDF